MYINFMGKFQDSKKRENLEKGLHAADSILCCIVFFPSMLMYWRGIWDLYGVYILPDQALNTEWAIFGLGCGTIVGYFLYPVCQHYFKRLNNILREILNRVVMYIYAIPYMAYWRGVWNIADYYLNPYGWEAGFVGFVISYTLLLLCRASRTAIFPPFLTAPDTREDVLKPKTRFGIKPMVSEPSSIWKFILDALFTHFIITSLTILLWQSLWNVTGYILAFEDDFTRDWVAIVIGYAGVSVMFALEEVLTKVTLAMHASWWRKLLWEDLVNFVTLICCVFIWRGGWNLNATFVISDPKLGGWVNHAVGTVLLMSLQLFSYAGSCGCAVDGADTGREGIYPTHYLRHYLRYKIDPDGGKQIHTSNTDENGLLNGSVSLHRTENNGCKICCNSKEVVTTNTNNTMFKGFSKCIHSVNNNNIHNTRHCNTDETSAASWSAVGSLKVVNSNYENNGNEKWHDVCQTQL